MSNGLTRTFDLLTQTGNDAAVDVLVAALDSPEVNIRKAALRALLARRGGMGQREILSRLHAYGEEWRPGIVERRGRMSQALRDAIVGVDGQLYENSCKVILWSSEYDLTPTLINAVEDAANENADLAGATLVSLVTLLYQELNAPQDYSLRRDPQLVRRQLITVLEESTQRFSKHKRSEPVEAFLMLAGRENATLRQILLDAKHASHPAIVDTLMQSSSAGVMRLLISFLDDAHPPMAAMQALTRRRDLEFAQRLLRHVGPRPLENVRHNLKRIESIAWLRPDSSVLAALEENDQVLAVKLVLATGAKRDDMFEVIQWMFEHGATGGRVAAIEGLAQFRGADAIAMLVAATHDADPKVHAAALPLLKKLGAPGALQMLLDRVDHPQTEVSDAARACLVEFNFARFMSTFDTLDEETRRSTGKLVRKIDPAADMLLRREISSGARARRLRALEMIACMEASNELEEELIVSLSDSDHLIRATACRALAQCESTAAYTAICEMQNDASTIVQEAARDSLNEIDRRVFERASALAKAQK